MLKLRPCLELGCDQLVPRGRCARHRRMHTATRTAKRRASAVTRVYDDARWRRAVRAAIQRAGGRCQAIENGARCPVTLASGRLIGHHAYDGGVERMLADGADPFDLAYVVVLCHQHHQQVEAWLRRQKRTIRR